MLFLLAAPARAQVAPSIVPLPQRITMLTETYALPERAHVSTLSSRARALASDALALLNRHGVGAELSLATGANDAALGSEGYDLRIGAGGIAIRANESAGLFYGLKTLDQLLPYGPGAAPVAGIEIRDWPAFAWRGIHLDVSRHFFGVADVERYIDVAARYKLNVFHWHLTDDQGWRIQILRYPRLTSVGGCRSGSEVDGDATEIDTKRYCGFYTQAQIRAVVAFARARFVTVVPEIEMPGHSQAALAAYPELACTPGPFAVRETWGVSDEIYCPTETTFAFLENVLREVMALFPGRYVHVGGDEVPKTAWQQSAAVAALMKRERIRTYDGVQGYFDRRIERFLEANGRSEIGWDEILEGGVSKRATVMSWRGEAGGIAAAKRGNDAIMTPDGPLYFDAYQGDPNDEPQAIGNLSTPQMVYRYDPVPAALTADQARHIVGVQGNLWTEFVATRDYLDYMLLPRLLALSEIAWSDPHPRDWSGFAARMGAQLPSLDKSGYRARIPNPDFAVAGDGLHFSNVSSSVRTVEASTGADHVVVTLSTVVPGGTIRYTTDGSPPTARSQTYTGPIALALEAGRPVDVTAIVVTASGRASTPSELLLTRTAAPAP